MIQKNSSQKGFWTRITTSLEVAPSHFPLVSVAPSLNIYLICIQIFMNISETFNIFSLTAIIVEVATQEDQFVFIKSSLQ